MVNTEQSEIFVYIDSKLTVRCTSCLPFDFLIGTSHTEELASSFMFNFTLDTSTSATAYKTTIGLTACYIAPGTCEDYSLLINSDLKKKTCPGRRRRRRATATE